MGVLLHSAKTRLVGWHIVNCLLVANVGCAVATDDGSNQPTSAGKSIHSQEEAEAWFASAAPAERRRLRLSADMTRAQAAKKTHLDETMIDRFETDSQSSIRSSTNVKIKQLYVDLYKNFRILPIPAPGYTFSNVVSVLVFYSTVLNEIDCSNQSNPEKIQIDAAIIRAVRPLHANTTIRNLKDFLAQLSTLNPEIQAKHIQRYSTFGLPQKTIGMLWRIMHAYENYGFEISREFNLNKFEEEYASFASNNPEFLERYLEAIPEAITASLDDIRRCELL